MKGFIIDIKKVTEKNDNFREVLYTANHSQLAVMSLKPGEDIGEETHELDQFIRIEEGKGEVILNDVTHEIEDDFAVVIPAGVKHNVVNTSDDEDLKLYTIYSPPEHQDKVIHKTKEEAMVAEEHFDGITTE